MPTKPLNFSKLNSNFIMASHEEIVIKIIVIAVCFMFQVSCQTSFHIVVN